MVWRRVLVPASFTLRKLHGVIQVAIGWDGIHLCLFRLRATRYGSCELSASSPDVTLAALRFRKGARFVYKYDLTIPWRHEVRLEVRLAPETGKTYPVCVAGDGACPPEDCGGPGPFMEHRDDILSLDSREDLATMADIIGDAVLERRVEILEDDATRWRLEQGWRAAGRGNVRRASRSRGAP